ncbi:MAG TPA: peptidylprolyl isomerase [candidate division Zixibacteria bacterium]|nr:peptidylprolyl isomerase [candidate division Zixibacteria bacterium]
MKKLRIPLIALSLLLFAVGCGKKVDDSVKTESTKVEAKAVADIAPNPADSLASKTFPLRSKNNTIVTIETDYGKMVFELYRDVAPAHADSFVARTKDGFYNGLIFHRVIDNFMIQGGDPKGNGTGNAGYFLPAEFNELPHQDGTLSMARSQSPNSASCQFFICLARNRSTAGLDRQYTVFGQLIKGYNVLHAIGSAEVVANAQGKISKPKEDIVMRKVYVSDADGNAL